MRSISDRPRRDRHRAAALRARWDANWLSPPGVRSDDLDDRTVRLHWLPASRAYADSGLDVSEILRRADLVLDHLVQLAPGTTITVFAPEPSRHDLERRTMIVPSGSFLWRRYGDDHLDGRWVLAAEYARGDAPVHQLVLSTAREESWGIVVTDNRCTWQFAPYHGGVDLVLASRQERDAIRERFREFRPTAGSPGAW